MFKIMIIDDEPIAQTMVQKYIELKLPEYQVVSICSNGEEALASFKKNTADILLVDIRMPIMDGLAFLKNLSALTSNYEAIVISSYNEFQYAKTAMQLGVSHYLLKPLDYNELSTAIKAASTALEQKRISYSNALVLIDDIRELYFQNLITGKYAHQEAAIRDYAQLQLPFSYDNCFGFHIKVDVVNMEKWTYEKNAFATALDNLIRLLYMPQFSFPVICEDRSYNYILFCKNKPELSQLTEQVYSILHVTVSVQLVLPFSSIEDIRQRNITPDSTISLDLTEQSVTKDNLTYDLLKQRMDNATAYIKKHCDEDLTREKVASAVYLSPAYFSRCFKEIIGIPYRDYLLEVRMQKAMELLNTNMKISDISQQVGYPNPNRFNINFKHYTSYTPSEYRIHVLKQF